MDREVKEFALGSGFLYAAPGKVTEEELESIKYRVGEMGDGCRLRYECKTKELFDLDGNAAATLRFDEKAKVSGRLERIFADSLMTLIPVGNGSVGRGRISVLIVCPLPDGDVLRVYLSGGISTGAAFEFKAGGTAEFELVFGKDAGVPRFVLRDGKEYVR